MNLTERHHQRRFLGRRGWALAILALHVERRGGCAHCETVTGTKVPWPCMEVRLAERYLE
jgi:hypothetical protein